jgi:hypothetical protein
VFVDNIGNEAGTAAGIVMALFAEFVGRVDDQRFDEVTDLCTETFEMVGQKYCPLQRRLPLKPSAPSQP